MQDGLSNLKEISVCDHLQTLLTPLGDVGKLTLSTSGPPQPDRSLFNNPEFWKVASFQHASGEQNVGMYISEHFLLISIYYSKPLLISSDPSNFDSVFLQYLDSVAVQGVFLFCHHF